jgi:hypothetical protein
LFVLKLLESPEQTAHRCIREIIASMRRAGLPRFHYAEVIDGLCYSFNVRKDKGNPAASDTADLPKELKKARASMQNTYRVIRDLRDKPDPEGKAEVWPAGIVAWLDEHNIDPPNSVDTINHALHDLRILRLACSCPNVGWYLGARLPNEQRQPSEPSPAEVSEYASRMAEAGVRRFGELAIVKQQIWVPGEKEEYGIMVTDAQSEKQFAIRERIGEMRIPKRSGQLVKSPAVRGELIRTNGNVAVVKFSGCGNPVTVRVLGAWQLQGLREPEAVEVGVV